MTAAAGVRLLLGAAPLLLLMAVVVLLCLISLALSKARREHVLQLLDRIAELTQTIAAPTTNPARRPAR